MFVLAASVLWGTTGTAATFAPDVSPLAIGAVAMGFGGLLQAAVAARPMAAYRARLRGQWRTVALGALSVALYPLAFYSSMHLAGVAVGTVVSIGSAPLASAVIERIADKSPFTRRWAAGAALGVTGAVLLCIADAGHADAARRAAGVVHAGRRRSGAAGRADVRPVLLGGAPPDQRGHPSRAVMGTVFGLGGLLLMPVLAATGAPLVDVLAEPGGGRRTWRSSPCSPATSCSAGAWPGSAPARPPPCPSPRQSWRPSSPCWW